MWRIYSTPDPHRSPFTTHKGMWRTYSKPDPHRAEGRWSLPIYMYRHFYQNKLIFFCVCFVHISEIISHQIQYELVAFIEESVHLRSIYIGSTLQIRVLCLSYFP